MNSAETSHRCTTPKQPHRAQRKRSRDVPFFSHTAKRSEMK
jgi:hypothetical protein